MRLDLYLCKKGFYHSRTKAKQAIESGKVLLNKKVIKKPSYQIIENLLYDVSIDNKDDFVSLGGYKLKKAFEDFDFSPKNMVVADFGASTGGFTDCSVRYGAKKVYAIDLNDSLLDYSLKANPVVKTIIKNVKEIKKKDFEEDIDLITADLSFISLTKIIPIMSDIIAENKYIIALIKPQFELDKKMYFKNGIVRDFELHKDVCKKIYDKCIECHLMPLKITTAPIYEDKNTEYLILLKKSFDMTNIIAFEELFKF